MKRQTLRMEKSKKIKREVEMDRERDMSKVRTEKEKISKEYWRNVFKTMAEKNKEKNGERLLMIGAEKHVNKMRKSRKDQQIVKKNNPAKVGRTRPPTHRKNEKLGR